MGASGAAIYEMVARALRQRSVHGGILLDVGCGHGSLWRYLDEGFSRYIGVDAIKYEEAPAEMEFHPSDLDNGAIGLPDGFADVVASVETIEHLQNPRAFARELVRLAKPGGWVVITTPNQLSLLSLLTLVVKKRFAAFQDSLYPAHVTALLEVDLVRIATECGLADVRVHFSNSGRAIFTALHYPRFLSHLCPRALSDNLLVIGRKPAEASSLGSHGEPTTSSREHAQF
jgi:SAM-dependent methyltransferase